MDKLRKLVKRRKFDKEWNISAADEAKQQKKWAKKHPKERQAYSDDQAAWEEADSKARKAGQARPPQPRHTKTYNPQHIVYDPAETARHARARKEKVVGGGLSVATPTGTQGNLAIVKEGQVTKLAAADGIGTKPRGNLTPMQYFQTTGKLPPPEPPTDVERAEQKRYWTKMLKRPTHKSLREPDNGKTYDFSDHDDMNLEEKEIDIHLKGRKDLTPTQKALIKKRVWSGAMDTDTYWAKQPKVKEAQVNKQAKMVKYTKPGKQPLVKQPLVKQPPSKQVTQVTPDSDAADDYLKNYRERSIPFKLPAHLAKAKKEEAEIRKREAKFPRGNWLR